MYTPSSFAETDPGKLHEFIERHSFGILVSGDGQAIEASHLPLLLDRSAGPQGRLSGHMARANPQWQGLDGQPVRVIFHGPHAYISPTWYEAENTVPTWNYVAVHATGTFRTIESRDELREVIRRTVDTYEAGMSTPWLMDQLDEGFADKLLSGIVGFTIDIARLEGKWKLNQNHDRERRERVIRALNERPTENEHQIANLMQQPLLDQ